MNYPLSSALFGGWSDILDTVILGVLSYFGIIVLLRLSGKRTLSKWNSFDFIVTIALGSILASALLSDTTTLVQAIVAVAVLVLLQFVITWTAVRSGAVQALIKSEPSLLLFKGEMIDSNLKNQRVAEGEVLAAIRLSGHSSVGKVDAVILETDGSFSVIEKVDIENASAMKDVRDFKKHVAAFVRNPGSYSSSQTSQNPGNNASSDKPNEKERQNSSE